MRSKIFPVKRVIQTNASTDKSEKGEKNTERKSGGTNRYSAERIFYMIYVNGIRIRIFIYRAVYAAKEESERFGDFCRSLVWRSLRSICRLLLEYRDEQRILILDRDV